MSKLKKYALLVLVSLFLILGLTNGIQADDGDNGQEVPQMPEGAVGSYTINGEFHWIVPGGDIKVVDFTGMTKEEIFKTIQMSTEDEAKIVHSVPPCPEVIIDGVLYKSEAISKFDGKQLGFTTGIDGKLYAFTTEEDLEAFQKQQIADVSQEKPDSGEAILNIDPTYSYYYYNWYCGGDYITLHYQINLANLPPNWDNQISSLEVNTSCYATRLYDYINFGGDYFEALAGTTYSVLFFQGWNDRASSILHY
jgi:hypothetical protein